MANGERMQAVYMGWMVSNIIVRLLTFDTGRFRLSGPVFCQRFDLACSSVIHADSLFLGPAFLWPTIRKG